MVKLKNVFRLLYKTEEPSQSGPANQLFFHKEYLFFELFLHGISAFYCFYLYHFR